MDFYATLNRTVVDGTSCSKPYSSHGRRAPSGTRGICIGGYCKVSAVMNAKYLFTHQKLRKKVSFRF